ncbi:MAG: hypothetical protein V4459_05475 [Pseudomonadota bacterium]
MNPTGTGAAMLNVAVLIGLAALGYFVFPGQDGLMIVLGVVAGFVLATLTFGKDIGAGATIPKVIGAFIVIVLVAYAIPWTIENELTALNPGGMKTGLVTLSHAVGALLWGVALRLLWNARKLIHE